MTTCRNCGGDEGIHHFETNQCPVSGREAPLGKIQKWMSSTFESSEPNALEKLQSKVEELESRLAALEAAAKADAQTAEYRAICPDCCTPYPCKCMTGETEEIA